MNSTISINYDVGSKINFIWDWVCHSDFINFISFLLFKETGLLGIIITFIAIAVAYYIYRKTFRPILQLEIKKKYTPLKNKIFYNLYLKNVGLVPAKDIEYKIFKVPKKFFNNDFKKDAMGDDLDIIKSRLENKLKFIGAGSEYSGLLFSVPAKSEEYDYPFNSKENTQRTESIIIKITYNNSIDGYKYKQKTNLFAHSYEELLTGSNIGDNNEEYIMKSLNEINKTLVSHEKNQKEESYILKNELKKQRNEINNEKLKLDKAITEIKKENEASANNLSIKKIKDKIYGFFKIKKQG